MGLVVSHYSIPDGLTAAALVARVSARIGERCHLRTISDGDCDSYVLSVPALWAGTSLHADGSTWCFEAPVGTSFYFLLQLELAVADLGGTPRDIVNGHGRPVRNDHPHASLTWQELPFRTRLQAGRAGQLLLGLLAILVNVLLVLTLPIQLLLDLLLRCRKQGSL